MKTGAATGWILALALAGAGMGCGGDLSSGVADDAGGGGPDAPFVTDSGLPRTDAGIPTKDSGPQGDAAVTPDAATGLRDPNADGPYAIAEKDATANIAATSDSCAVHVAYPTTGGPFPVVVVAHGFQLPPSQYYGYLKRLASFGYVALTVDFPTSFLGNDNPRQAKDLLGGIDWAKADSTVGPKVDDTRVGMSGHSLGGKLALLASTLDPRVKASFVLDPVDGGGPTGCSQPQCVIVKDLMPQLAIPTGFLGETTDSSGGFQPCAPAANNYQAFYGKTKSPSLMVTALGANHMSFLDDVKACGFTCSVCAAATASNGQVNGMGRALMVAFYERWLKANAAYDTWLSGPQAQQAYVSTSQATITSK